jgi:tankyrase
MVRPLLKYGASLTAEDKKQKIAAVHITADKGFLSIMNVLMEHGADPNLRSSEGKMTPLHYAASCGRSDVVARLLRAGADVNAQNVSDNTPIIMACNKGHTDIVKELIQAKADLTCHGKPDGLTALHACVVFGGVEGFVECAKLLIAAGAPINAKSLDGALTPLHCGAAKGHVGCVRLLIEKGADVHAFDKFNSTPLRIAASNANTLEGSDRFLQVAEALISHGADINSSSAAGNTALHSIAKLGDPEIIRWMISHGADPYKKNNEGLSSVDCAKNEEVRKLMENLKKGGSASPGGPPAASASPAKSKDKEKDKGEDSDDEEEIQGVYNKKNWVPDELAPACTNCSNAFSFFNRRHHCRACGKVYCSKCSSRSMHIRGSKKAYRVCDKCFAQGS